MTWKLYLDDLRDPPPAVGEPWTVARSSSEAIQLVEEKGLPMWMSLDHDLGGDDTSMVFLKWLAYEYQAEFIPLWFVHSANPIGKQNIEAFLKSWLRSMAL